MRLILDTFFTQQPIRSFGLMVYAKDTKNWAIVQRKHTIALILYISGNYRDSQMVIISQNMTCEEHDMLLLPFNSLYAELGLPKKGIRYALYRYNRSISRMKSLISCNYHIDLEWTWPKGRINHEINETPIECAKREFEEEFGCLGEIISQSSKTYTKSFKSITGKRIETNCWLIIIENEFAITEPDCVEVAQKRWVSTSELCDLNILLEDEFINLQNM